MAVVIESTRATVRGSESAEGQDQPGAPKARTLTRDDQGHTPVCPDCFPGTLFRTDDPEEYVCDQCATLYYIPYHPIGKDEPTCPWCERRIYDCSYWGPPCEERLRVHRLYSGERTPVLDEERREDEHSRERQEYRER